MVFAVTERRKSQPDEATSVQAQWRRRLLWWLSEPPKRFWLCGRTCVAVSVEGQHVCPFFQNMLLKTSTGAGSISQPLLHIPSPLTYPDSPFLSLGNLIEIWKYWKPFLSLYLSIYLENHNPEEWIHEKWGLHL